MFLSIEPDGPVPIYQQIRDRIVEGLLRLNRKSGAVVQRDAGSGPPSPDWAEDWTVRLGTLLAEAAAQGMPAEAIIEQCRAAVAEFAFPAEAEDDAPGHRTAIEGRP